MGEVRTQDEALASVERALAVWSADVAGTLVQARATTRAAREDVSVLLQRIDSHRAALEARLPAAGDEERQVLRRRIDRTTDIASVVRRADGRVAQVEAGVVRLHREHTATSDGLVAAARVRLVSMGRALDQYRSSGVATGSSGLPATPALVETSAPQVAAGLTDLDVAAADLDDLPILDDDRDGNTFGQAGLSRADYRWAVQTWDDIVGPGVAAGKTREDFAARDARSNARTLRRTADVYDLFLGSNRILAERRSDGTLDVVNGRHRLLIARELGIKTLPGKLSG